MATRHTKPIDADVLDVLKRSTITPNSLTLPGQLERKLYDRTAKVIAAAGGKWNRSANSHLFPRDPRDILGLALETGEITDRKIQLQQYFTPPMVAEKAVERLMAGRSFREGEMILEPSCGAGAFISELLVRGAESSMIDAAELDPELAQEVRHRFGVAVFQGDYLKWQEPNRYHKVIMNPPFSNGQDMDHVTKAFGVLMPGGRLVAILSPAFTFAENRKAQAFRELVEENGGICEQLPDRSFSSSGTDVHTVLLTMDRG